MSNDLNRWEGIGRLGSDPELRQTAGGKAVANVRIACGRKTQAGEETEWVPIVFFDKLAEIVGQYLAKGKQVYVSGRLQTRKWADKNGAERYTTEIIADTMQMLGSGRGGDASAQDSRPAASAQRQSPAGRRQAPTQDGGFDDEIPF